MLTLPASNAESSFQLSFKSFQTRLGINFIAAYRRPRDHDLKITMKVEKYLVSCTLADLRLICPDVIEKDNPGAKLRGKAFGTTNLREH